MSMNRTGKSRLPRVRRKASLPRSPTTGETLTITGGLH
jgi:hypothetical protein